MSHAIHHPESAEYRRVFRAIPTPCLLLAPNLHILDANDHYLSATMTEREAIVGRGLFDVFPDNPDLHDADGVSNLAASLARVLREKRPDTMAVQRYDIRRPPEDGGGFEERYWSPVNVPVSDAAGEVVAIIHRVEDVTEYVRLEKAMHESSQIANSLRSENERMGAEIVRRGQELQTTNGELRLLQAELETRVRDRTLELQSANTRLKREMGDRETAERALRESEDQLRQAQKLDAVGRLAGGIAHDFNNLLTVILSYGEFLKESHPLGAHYPHEIDEIIGSGRRAAELTRQLLAFSRRQVFDAEFLDVNKIITDTSKMLERILGEDIQLRLVLAKSLRTIRADRSQIEQVIMNLVVNARDAMPNGGSLTIETSETFLDDSYSAKRFETAPGPYVVIAVTDTGVGMSKDTQERLFEPFFTTKPVGKGTGLGLSTVFGIVKQSGGSIWVYSEEGSGSTFKIHLPIVDSPTGPRPAPTAAPAIVTGTERILVVDDDAAIRGVATAILRRLGYWVFATGDAAEAVRVAHTTTPPIDLVLLDVVMPHVNGRELSRRIAEKKPDMRFLFMSGYTDDAIHHHGVLDPSIAFIQKPLTPTALARKLREVLD